MIDQKKSPAGTGIPARADQNYHHQYTRPSLEEQDLSATSIACDSQDPIKRRYLALVKAYQAHGIPFVGYLHTAGCGVFRTDRFSPTHTEYEVTYQRPGDTAPVTRRYQKPDILRLRNERCKILRVTSIAVEEKPQRFKVAKLKPVLKTLDRQGRLIETVESDGRATTYTNHGRWR